jgi:pyruvate dehydrogenase E2 component (dihydrolipoamide acetyltransferase)
MKKVEMPKMGDSMEEGKILHWIKKEGDAVKKGEMLAEVETDKVNIEIEAFASGILRKILVQEGASAPVGADIALIGTADELLPGELAENGALTPASTRVPTLPAGKGSRRGTPTMDGSPGVPARGGAIHQAPTEIPTDNQQGRIFISPLARRLAAENQLDYATLRGTGPNGRIIRMDIEAALTRQQPAGTPSILLPQTTPTPTYQEPVPVVATIDTDEVVEIPLTAMRRTIARRLSQSMQTAPHFYVTSVIDTDKLAALRQQINEYAATDPAPVKVSFNDLIVKAVAKALARMPQVNVSYAEDRLLQKKQIHIGVAVALEQGLIVPVLRNAHQRGILDIARETRRLAEAARDGKLRPEDFSGGTFTVSNLGMFDVDSFTAVINPPESAILAVGSITPTPVVVDNQVVVRNRMKVTLSSDHRAIDGATAARFLQEVKRLLEEPFGLVL